MKVSAALKVMTEAMEKEAVDIAGTQEARLKDMDMDLGRFRVVAGGQEKGKRGMAWIIRKELDVEVEVTHQDGQRP